MRTVSKLVEDTCSWPLPVRCAAHAERVDSILLLPPMSKKKPLAGLKTTFWWLATLHQIKEICGSHLAQFHHSNDCKCRTHWGFRHPARAPGVGSRAAAGCDAWRREKVLEMPALVPAQTSCGQHGGASGNGWVWLNCESKKRSLRTRSTTDVQPAQHWSSGARRRSAVALPPIRRVAERCAMVKFALGKILPKACWM